MWAHSLWSVEDKLTNFGLSSVRRCRKGSSKLGQNDGESEICPFDDKISVHFIQTLDLQLHTWEPTIQNPYRGLVTWTVPENVEIQVTLFRDNRHSEYEDKEWTFLLEDVCLVVALSHSIYYLVFC